MLKSFRGWIDKFDKLLGNLWNLDSQPTMVCQLSSQLRTTEVVSYINCYELHQHYQSWHILSAGPLSLLACSLLCSCTTLNTRRNLKELFWCTCHQPTVNSLQQIMLLGVVNEERYEWSNSVNAEALSYHSLKSCFLKINDIHDLFTTLLYVNSWWPCWPDAFRIWRWSKIINKGSVCIHFLTRTKDLAMNVFTVLLGGWTV